MKQKIAIWLDDIRPVNQIFKQLATKADCNIVVATSFEVFKLQVEANIKKQNEIVYISFDHDLGEGPTGYDAAKWLCELILDNKLKTLPKYFVHSANPVGKSNILGYFKSFEKHLEQK